MGKKLKISLKDIVLMARLEILENVIIQNFISEEELSKLYIDNFNKKLEELTQLDVEIINDLDMGDDDEV